MQGNNVSSPRYQAMFNGRNRFKDYRMPLDQASVDDW